MDDGTSRYANVNVVFRCGCTLSKQNIKSSPTTCAARWVGMWRLPRYRDAMAAPTGRRSTPFAWSAERWATPPLRASLPPAPMKIHGHLYAPPRRNPMKYTIPCLFGLEALVADEPAAAGPEKRPGRKRPGPLRRRPGGHPPAEHQPAARRPGAGGAGQLPGPGFRGAVSGRGRHPLGGLHPPGREFPVKGYSISSQLHSVPACQAIVKKAAAKRLARPTAARPCRRPGTAIRSSSPSSRTPRPCTWTPPATDSTSGATGPTTTAPPLRGDAGRRPGALSRYRGEGSVLRPLLRQRHHSHRGGADRQKPGPRPGPALCRPKVAEPPPPSCGWTRPKRPWIKNSTASTTSGAGTSTPVRWS